MTDTEKINEALHYFNLLQTDESKCHYFIYLKKQKDKVSREVLEKVIERWLKE